MQWKDTQTLLCPPESKTNLPYEKYSLCTEKYKDILITRDRDLKAIGIKLIFFSNLLIQPKFCLEFPTN